MMQNRTVVITGGERGIGKETAIKLASKGAKIILGCLDLEEALLTKDEIVRETQNRKVRVLKLDLRSLKSIRKFAFKINNTEDHLDVLLHNAGAISKDLEFTEEGLEVTMAVNFLGPFLLTHLLIDLLKKSAPSRIIVTSSGGYWLSFLTAETIRDPSTALPFNSVILNYFNSKFANICFTKELAKRLKNTGVTANSFHPGSVKTNLWKGFVPKWFLRVTENWSGFVSVPPSEGCKTGVFLASSEKVREVTGKFFYDCKESFLWRSANDGEIWDIAAKLVLETDDTKI